MPIAAPSATRVALRANARGRGLVTSVSAPSPARIAIAKPASMTKRAGIRKSVSPGKRSYSGR
jgi:hypothetical protein